MAINPKKIKKVPAKDLKKNNPSDLRNKALREANKIANERRRGNTPRPARDIGGTRAKFLADAKAGNIKAKVPGRALVTTTGKALLGAGSAVVGMVTESKPTNVGEREFLARQKAITRVRKEASNLPARPPSKSTGTGRPETPGSYMPKRTGGGGPVARQRSSAPSMAMGGGPVARQGGESPLPKKKTGVNQIAMGQSNAAAKAKKKAGATSAAPAKPKRRTNLERMRRRQAERFAIGSSGKSL